MKLGDRLRKLTNEAIEYGKNEHQQENATKLFAKVMVECFKIAESGDCVFQFHWNHVFTCDKELWQQQHEICLEVVKKLESEDINASCDYIFPEAIYNEELNEWIQEEGHHYIDVDW